MGAAVPWARRCVTAGAKGDAHHARRGQATHQQDARLQAELGYMTGRAPV